LADNGSENLLPITLDDGKADMNEAAQRTIQERVGLGELQNVETARSWA
jgi:hypothetical protein